MAGVFSDSMNLFFENFRPWFFTRIGSSKRLTDVEAPNRKSYWVRVRWEVIVYVSCSMSTSKISVERCEKHWPVGGHTPQPEVPQLLVIS